MSYKEQFIWKKAIKLSVRCYELTSFFPQSEVYGITSQIRRSSVSIASNIAEGHGKSKREYSQLLYIALGTARELETQLIIASEVKLCEGEYIISLLIDEVNEVQRLLAHHIKKLNQ